MHDDEQPSTNKAFFFSHFQSSPTTNAIHYLSYLLDDVYISDVPSTSRGQEEPAAAVNPPQLENTGRFPPPPPPPKKMG